MFYSLESNVTFVLSHARLVETDNPCIVSERQITPEAGISNAIINKPLK
jgi:hypothetical protein